VVFYNVNVKRSSGISVFGIFCLLAKQQKIDLIFWDNNVKWITFPGLIMMILFHILMNRWVKSSQTVLINMQRDVLAMMSFANILKGLTFSNNLLIIVNLYLIYFKLLFNSFFSDIQDEIQLYQYYNQIHFFISG
jgi:hypothetical protein